MRLLLLGFIPFGLAATIFKCFGFEEPFFNDSYLSIRIDEAQTHLMIYEIQDINDTIIPLGSLNDNLLEIRHDNLEMCLDKFKSEETCTSVAKYVSKYKLGNKAKLIKALTLPKEATFSYSIKSPGLYCISVYKKGNTLRGFKTVPHHSYWQLDYEDYFQHSLFLAGFAFEITLLIISKSIRVKDESVPHSVIKNFLKVNVYSHLLVSICLHILNSYKYRYNSKWIASITIEFSWVFESIVFWFVLYGASLNKSVLYSINQDIKLIKSDKKVMLCFLLYSTILFSHACRLYFPSSYSDTLEQLKVLGVIPLYLIIRNNFFKIQNELEENELMKEYCLNFRISVNLITTIDCIFMTTQLLYCGYCFQFVNWHPYQRFSPTMSLLDPSMLTPDNRFENLLVYPIKLPMKLLSCTVRFSLAIKSLIIIAIWKPFNKTLHNFKDCQAENTSTKGEKDAQW